MRGLRELATAVVLGALVVAAAPLPPGYALEQARHRAAPEVTGFTLGGLPGEVLRRDRDALSTLSVAAVGLTADGRSVAAPAADVLATGRAGRRLGLRTELLLSNYSDRLGDFDPRAAHRLLSSPAARARVVRQLAGTVTSGPWSGVNVDLERVRRHDAGGLVALVRELQRALPARRTVSVDVSAATSVPAYRARGYRLGPLGRAADVVVLMTYDQHGPGWSGPGPIGSLGWQRDAVRAARQRVAARTLDLGVAGYGYAWAPERSGRDGGTVTPRGARAQAARDGVRPVWHPRAGEWSARLDDGTRLWWSDARSYGLRLRLAAEYGLHGVALWRLGAADPLP